MTSQLRTSRVLLAAACLCAALALTPKTHAQTAPDPDPQLEDCSSVHPPDPNDLQPPQNEPNWPGRYAAYNGMIDWVASISGDSRGNFTADQGKPSLTSFGIALGLTAEEEHMTRKILFDAYRRGAFAWKCWADLGEKVRWKQRTPAQTARIDELATVQVLVYKAAIIELHHRLSEDAFVKVDKCAYNRDAVGRKPDGTWDPYPGTQGSGASNGPGAGQ